MLKRAGVKEAKPWGMNRDQNRQRCEEAYGPVVASRYHKRCEQVHDGRLLLLEYRTTYSSSMAHPLHHLGMKDDGKGRWSSGKGMR